MVNEFRAGYNYDNSRRESNFRAGDVSAQLGIEMTPGLADLRGFPSFTFSGANRPANIRISSATSTGRSVRTRSRSATT